MSTKRIALFILVLLVVTLYSAAATIHVPADQPTIQAGIDAAADGDRVLVADGLYTGPGNRDITFGGKAITVRSENGHHTCIIDCQGSQAEPHKGFIINNWGPERVIEGFTIRNGVAPGGSTHTVIAGGGIYCVDAVVTLRDCVVENCRAKWLGGGIYCHGSEITIEDCFIRNNVVESGEGGGIECDHTSVVLRGCTITGNTGAGLYDEFTHSPSHSMIVEDNEISHNTSYGLTCLANTVIRRNEIIGNGDCGIAGSPDLIEGNLVSGNGPAFRGGGISVSEGRVIGNRIIGNMAEGGGGISVGSGTVILENNLVVGNTANAGGGIYFHGNGTFTRMTGTTVSGNTADIGGAICAGNNAHPEVVDSILWGNSADYGPQVYLTSGSHLPYTVLTISHSDVEGGESGCIAVNGSILNWGTGMIDADPLFSDGPLGSHYLGRPETGQAEPSPCIDSGSDLSANICFPWDGKTVCLNQWSTRIDLVPDDGVVDMGFHYVPLASDGLIALVAGLGPHPANPSDVRGLPPEDGAAHILEIEAYPVSSYGTNVATGHMDDQPGDEILTGAGPGEIFGPHVRGFSGDGTPLPGLSFMAYGTNKYGVNVGAGDFDGDGFDEILTGAGPGTVFGPHVRAFDYDSGPVVTPLSGVNFMAYGTLKWGVNVAAGDIDGDGFDEIITGAGPGAVFGPHVRGWNVDGGTAAAIPGVSWFAYSTLKYGVNVACGDVDGDGQAEIITAPGPSSAFGAHIRGWNFDGSAVSELAGCSFFAWPGEVRYGATVWTGTDLDFDGRDEIVVGLGPGVANAPILKGFSYTDGQVILDSTIEAWPAIYTHGVNVAAGRF